MNTLDVLNSIRSVLDFYWYSTIIFDGFTIDKLVNLDRQYTCTRLRSLGENCKIYRWNWSA